MTKTESGSSFAGINREELVRIVEGHNSKPELVWSREAQEARMALGITINKPTPGEIQRIREAREKMVQVLAQAIAKARETDYPLATGETLRESIDI